jgi:hypothetical protein
VLGGGPGCLCFHGPGCWTGPPRHVVDLQEEGQDTSAQSTREGVRGWCERVAGGLLPWC